MRHHCGRPKPTLDDDGISVVVIFPNPSFCLQQYRIQLKMLEETNAPFNTMARSSLSLPADIGRGGAVQSRRREKIGDTRAVERLNVAT